MCRKTACEKIIWLNYLKLSHCHLSLPNPQCLQRSQIRLSLVKILVKTEKPQLLCKNFQSKSEFSTSKETIKAHWENRKLHVSYACPECCKWLKICGLPRSSQVLETDQLQWYVTSNIHLLSYFFWVCSSNKHFMYSWANSTCRNK